MFLTKAIFLIVILGTSLGLVCKECNIDCDEPVDETCPEPGKSQQVSCLTETFKDKHNSTLYQRKCVLYEEDTKFECADYPGYTSISCDTCNADRCNAAPTAISVGGAGGRTAVNGSSTNSTS
ncbi:unnamed protein product [Tenebrio molitor]|nr:unnamed protein product [Tenebrio molitor]